MNADLERFYSILAGQVARQGAPCFSELDGGVSWPERGVYFVFEPGEDRRSDSHVARVVRVGTHALRARSSASLWNRLRQHRGAKDGSGNHRASVFRMHVGRALIARDGLQDEFPRWDQGSNVPVDIRRREQELEKRVSEVIGRMRVAWIAVSDDAGPGSDRGVIERGAIALLASEGRKSDPPSPGWLGRRAPAEQIRLSGLWHVHHVGDLPDPAFLDVLEDWAART